TYSPETKRQFLSEKRFLTRQRPSGIISVNVISLEDTYMKIRAKAKEPDKPVEAFLPLTPAVFHILITLADGEAHGYAMMQEVNRRSGGTVRLGPGTLYGAISRLLEDRIIEESAERPDPWMDDTRRRCSGLTEFGW